MGALADPAQSIDDLATKGEATGQDQQESPAFDHLALILHLSLQARRKPMLCVATGREVVPAQRLSG
jgi:hypothetical protein